MQGKKNKKFRSIIHQYELNFGFRQPFNVLIDGNFLNSAKKIDLDLDKKIHKIYKAKTILCTTRCVKEELRKLGMTCSAAFNHACSMKTLRCSHATIVEPSMCISSHVGKLNPGYLSVATQDEKLQQELLAVGKVPVIRFVNNNVLDVMPMSNQAQALIQKADVKKYLPTDEEMKAIKEAKKEEREARRKQLIEKIRKETLSQGIRLKKRAKAPNPLAAKKKRSNKNQEE